jgi:hypothetical protein
MGRVDGLHILAAGLLRILLQFVLIDGRRRGLRGRVAPLTRWIDASALCAGRAAAAMPPVRQKRRNPLDSTALLS